MKKLMIFLMIIFLGLNAALAEEKTDTLHSIGNLTYYSSEGPVQQTGNLTYHTNGTITEQIGNTTYYSNGTAARQAGNLIYYSNGTTTQPFENTAYINGNNSSAAVQNTGNAAHFDGGVSESAQNIDNATDYNLDKSNHNNDSVVNTATQDDGDAK